MASLPKDSTLTPGHYIDQHQQQVDQLCEDQQEDNQDAGHVVQLCGVAESHVPASQGLKKHGPPEKGMANHFHSLPLRTP